MRVEVAPITWNLAGTSCYIEWRVTLTSNGLQELLKSFQDDLLKNFRREFICARDHLSAYISRMTKFAKVLHENVENIFYHYLRPVLGRCRMSNTGENL